MCAFEMMKDTMAHFYKYSKQSDRLLFYQSNNFPGRGVGADNR